MLVISQTHVIQTVGSFYFRMTLKWSHQVSGCDLVHVYDALLRFLLNFRRHRDPLFFFSISPTSSAHVREEVSSVLSNYIESRREGVMDESEKGVLDAAIKLAADKKARILERRFKEPEIEDVEVMVLPPARNKGGKAAPKSKPTTVSKLSGAINERGIPYVVLNDIPDLPPRAPQPARYGNEKSFGCCCIFLSGRGGSDGMDRGWVR